MKHQNHLTLSKRACALATATAAFLAGITAVVIPSSHLLASAQEENTNVALATSENPPEVQTSYSTGWQTGPKALNDGQIEAGDYKGWGTWGNNMPSENVTYIWTRPVTVQSSKAWYYTNVINGDGGVQLPKSVELEYLDAQTGKYTPVANQQADTELPTEPTESMYGPITYTFDEVTTTSLRLVLTKIANDNRGITMAEWEVYGTNAPVEVDPGVVSPFLWNQDIQIRTTVGENPSNQLPKTIWVTPENGPTVQVPVTWQPIAQEAYNKAGTQTTIQGTTTAQSSPAIPAGTVTATICTFETLNKEIQDVEWVSTITQAGAKPVFPNTVTVTYADGSKQSGVPVTWSDIDGSWDTVDDFGEATGTVEGTDISAMATYVVIEPTDSNAPPVVAIELNSDALNSTGWYTATPQVTISAQRGVSNVAISTIEYKVNNGPWQPYNGSTKIDQEGTVTLTARATDEHGHTSQQQHTIKVDTQNPVTNVTTDIQGSTAHITLTPTDGELGSGVTRTVYSNGPSKSPKSNENTMWATYEGPVTIELSATQDTWIHVRSQDLAGHEEVTKSINLGKAQESETNPDNPGKDEGTQTEPDNPSKDEGTQTEPDNPDEDTTDHVVEQPVQQESAQQHEHTPSVLSQTGSAIVGIAVLTVLIGFIGIALKRQSTITE